MLSLKRKSKRKLIKFKVCWNIEKAWFNFIEETEHHPKRIEYIWEWNLEIPRYEFCQSLSALQGSSKCTNHVNVHKLYAATRKVKSIFLEFKSVSVDIFG